MESQKNKILFDKYWEGETTVSEEILLKKQLEESVSADEDKFKVLFDYKEGLIAKENEFDLSFLDEETDTPFQTIIDKFKIPKKWRMVASIASALLISYFSVSYQWNEDTRLAAQEIEMQHAYTETLAALQLISNKIKKGNQSIYELGNFDKTKKQLINENL